MILLSQINTKLVIWRIKLHYLNDYIKWSMYPNIVSEMPLQNLNKTTLVEIMTFKAPLQYLLAILKLVAICIWCRATAET